MWEAYEKMTAMVRKRATRLQLNAKLPRWSVNLAEFLVLFFL